MYRSEQRQTAVTAYFRQTAVTAYFTIKQLLLFVFAGRCNSTYVTVYNGVPIAGLTSL